MAITTVTKALKKLYKAIIGEDTTKNDPTKIICDLADNWSGGGGSSDFSTATVTVKLVGEPSLATSDIYLTDLLTGDANGLVVIEEDDIRYLTTDSQVIELEKPSHTEAEKIIYLYKNNPVYVAWREAQSTSDYTIMGSGEAVALDLDGTLMYAVKVTGDCTITIS